jgi:hypothetical protein
MGLGGGVVCRFWRVANPPVAVGTIITDRPPHKSVHALLTRFPPWGKRSEACASLRTRTAVVGPLVRRGVRCGYRLRCVLLGRQPSLHGFLQTLPGLCSTASPVLCRRSTPCCRACGSYSSSPSPTDPSLRSDLDQTSSARQPGPGGPARFNALSSLAPRVSALPTRSQSCLKAASGL